MLLNLCTGGVLAICLLVATCLRRQFKIRNYPSAPGPVLARYTDCWYLWQVLKSRFQYWNIEQHAKHGTKRIKTPTGSSETYLLQETSVHT